MFVPLDVVTGGYIAPYIPIGCMSDGYLRIATIGGAQPGGPVQSKLHKLQLREDGEILNILIDLVLSGRLQ